VSLRSPPHPSADPSADPARRLPRHLQAAIWQGDQLAGSAVPACPSGHAVLDAQLPGGGWPGGGLTELLLDAPGQGEWRLLAPALARLGQAGGEWVGISPPLRPHAPALQALGLDLGRSLWIEPRHGADAAWAAEQALRSHGCAAVLWWADDCTAHRPPGSGPALRPGALRRLHLAAQASDALLFVLRGVGAAAQASPAALRLHCRAVADAPQQLALQILKRRGPPLAECLLIDTRTQLAPALAHRLEQALPQDRRPPERMRTPRPAAAPTASPHIA
jgi:protein ImuA